jgi:hypothetical protein
MCQSVNLNVFVNTYDHSNYDQSRSPGAPRNSNRRDLSIEAASQNVHSRITHLRIITREKQSEIRSNHKSRALRAICSEAGPHINLTSCLLHRPLIASLIQKLLTMFCQKSTPENPSCGAASVTMPMPMRKTRSSFDFGRISISARSSIHQKPFADAVTVASSFSRRAANDSYVAPQSEG